MDNFVQTVNNTSLTPATPIVGFRTSGDVMTTYNFYFLDTENHIASVREDIDCVDDADAERTASRLLSQQSHHAGVEIWDQTRLILRHHRIPEYAIESIEAFYK